MRRSPYAGALHWETRTHPAIGGPSYYLSSLMLVKGAGLCPKSTKPLLIYPTAGHTGMPCVGLPTSLCPHPGQDSRHGLPLLSQPQLSVKAGHSSTTQCQKQGTCWGRCPEASSEKSPHHYSCKMLMAPGHCGAVTNSTLTSPHFIFHNIKATKWHPAHAILFHRTSDAISNHMQRKSPGQQGGGFTEIYGSAKI